MNFFDVAILLLLAAFLVKGLWRGLVSEFCAFLGLLVGGIIAFRFYPPLAEWMTTALRLPPRFCETVIFLLLFLATLAFFILLGVLLSRYVTLPFLGGLNRVIGGFFGLFQGVLLLALVLFAVSRGPLPEPLKRSYQGSQLSPPFVRLGQAAFQGSQLLLAEWR